MKVSSEDHSVSFSELSVGPRVQGREAARVAFLDPQRCGVVSGVVWTFSDPHPDARHVFMPRQVGQVRLKQTNAVFITTFIGSLF